MTQASALQQLSHHVGQIYSTPAGQWGYCVFIANVQVGCNCGYDNQDAAADACFSAFGDVDLTVSFVDVPAFAFLPDYSEPLPAHTCPQCRGAGYLEGAIECLNCFGHGEIYCLDDLEVAE